MAKRTKKVKTNLKRTGKKSIKEVLVDSAVGTKVFEIKDPSERLLSIIGASMFNEPKYYPTDPQAQKRGYEYDATDIDENAQLIINTATEIAKSDHPKDLLQIAAWARKEMNIRTTPQVLLAVAAHCNETKPFVKEYSKKIINRADELKDVFAASRMLFGAEKSLPNSLKRGLAEAFTKFSEYDFLKWEGQNRPFFSDVLKMVDRAKDYPVSKAMDVYLKTGEVVDPKATPLVAARKELTKFKEWCKEAAEIAKAGKTPWEVLLSQFGNTRQLWEHLINTNSLPYMATLRNLRNILEAGVHEKCIEKVCENLINGAVDSRQLPYRFLAAKAALPTDNKFYGDVCAALAEAVELVVKALPPLPGNTLVAVDNSGSMDSPVSQKSTMTMKQAGNMLGAMIARKGDKCTFGAFATSWHTVDSTKDKTVMELVESLENLRVGGGTDAELVLRWALKSGEHFDRIILLSDIQTYGSVSMGSGGWGYGNQVPQSERGTVEQLITKYRKNVNKDCKLHSIDLAGYGKSLTKQSDTKTNLVSGFSEKLLNMIAEFEGLTTTDGKKSFSLEYIRKNY